MALTKIPRGLLDTGIADSSDATAITIDSSENVTFAGNILKTGDLTLDVSGDIYFDADGTNIFLQDGGTSFANLYGTGTDFYIKSVASDKDIIFQGNDGGSVITALTLDMSEAGAATFNGEVLIPEKLTHTGDTDSFFRFAGANDIRIVAGNVEHAAFDGTIVFNQSGADMDFRVESDDNANMLFVDAGNDRVGIGTNAPVRPLHLHQTSNAQMQFTDDTSGSGASDGLRLGWNGSEGQAWLFENATFRIGTNNTERLTVTSAGNVGINHTSPEHHLHVTEPGLNEDGIVKIGGSNTGLGLELRYDQTGSTVTQIVANPTYTHTAAIMKLCVDGDANANQLCLLGNGNIAMGTDAPGSSRLYVYQDIDAVFTAYFLNDHSGGYGVGIRSDSNSMMYFYNGGTFKGRIYHNGTTMLYADQSDYRLKENVQKMTGSIDRIKKLNPVTFDWKADGKASEGFLAHEVQDVVPTAVAGEKDAEITELGEGIQIMDYGKVTPVLVGALQEALAKIEILEAKVAALESK